MTATSYWVYILVEALILLGLYTAYLYLANRRLRSADSSAAESEDTSPDDAYLDRLQSEILHTEAKLAHLLGEKKPDPAFRQLLETRLSFLRGERAAIDSGSPDEERFWERFAAPLGSLLDRGTDSEDKPATDTRSSLIESLQTQVEAYKTRISNLERFKERFFELKDRLADSQTLNEQLHQEVTKAVPTEEQTPELSSILQRLHEENTLLGKQLAQVEEEFSAMMRNVQAPAAADTATSGEKEDAMSDSCEHIAQNLERIKQVILGKEQQIGELMNFIDQLQLKLEDHEKIQQSLQELDARNSELNSVVSILEEENGFLQTQISMLLKQELDNEENRNRRIEDLQQELDEQTRNLAELEKKYAAMEQEYLAIYEENQQLKGS
ncbi:hypothetical protein QVG61_02555 [Thiohalobacter sp. IOR34]|uniref:hypothetical protein n=1 Tax=Thiohalobacter sp. IOR34 TaxID=3057176 RepID=UPI0025B045D1|nr:hypothetical protein [Thiohalobacter sp. IOR34]WJW75991.1 hypothetical protein QVG61_02555 [Thiohalobacter sp. IOR34]